MSLFYQQLMPKDMQSRAEPGVVVLLHGLFGMSDNLLGLAKALQAGFRIIIPDLINHGHSPHRASMTYPEMAGDVIALLDSLNIQRFAVFGHSMGGKVAMQLASDFPLRVTQLVVADIAPVSYPPHHQAILQAMLVVDDARIRQRSEADTLLAQAGIVPNLRQFFMKNMKRHGEYWVWRFGLHEIAAAYADIAAAPVLKAGFAGAVLFIKGELSDYIQPQHQAVIQQYFPQAQFKIIQGAGHWLHAEKPNAFNRLVEKFLEVSHVQN